MTTKPRIVYLLPPDGSRIEVPRNVACMSELIKDMLAEDDDDDEESPEIPLPNIVESVLKKVIEFCVRHVNDPMPEIEKPIKSNKFNEVVSEWDASFVDVEHSALFALILAANYLDVPSLLDLTCAKVASMIKGKTPEEIRKTFGIDNDFTPEEEARVKEENKWCDEVANQAPASTQA